MRETRQGALCKTGLFHKMWRGHNREYIFNNPADKADYVKDLCDTRSDDIKEVVKWHSITLMDNHTHETGSLVSSKDADFEHSIRALGCWMRNAHSRFGARYNRKHERQGKVAYDRPKTCEIQNEEGLATVMFYGDVNPVRAGIVKHPSHYRHSSYRFYAYGETSKLTQHLTPPDWYLELANTPEGRQKKYRQLVDGYMRDKGLLTDAPLRMEARFIGDDAWQVARREQVRQRRKVRDGPPSVTPAIGYSSPDDVQV